MKTSTDLPLTNTSSVSIVLPVAKISGRKRMSRTDKPYEVEYRGVIIRCATPQDAASVARELAETRGSLHATKWQPHEFLDFVNRLQWQQRRLLAFILKAQYNRATDKQLREALKLRGNQALAGVLSGITKVAQAMDIDPTRIYWQRTEYREGSPFREYRLATGFVQSARDNDWPEEKNLEEPEDEG